MTPQEEAQFRALRLIQAQPSLSQRQLAVHLGISLGRTNYVVHALLEKGFIKAGNFLKSDNKLLKSAYMLTPEGIEHRLQLTKAYIQRKQAEFQNLQAELNGLQQEVPEAFAASSNHSYKDVP